MALRLLSEFSRKLAVKTLGKSMRTCLYTRGLLGFMVFFGPPGILGSLSLFVLLGLPALMPIRFVHLFLFTPGATTLSSVCRSALAEAFATLAALSLLISSPLVEAQHASHIHFDAKAAGDPVFFNSSAHHNTRFLFRTARGTHLGISARGVSTSFNHVKSHLGRYLNDFADGFAESAARDTLSTGWPNFISNEWARPQSYVSHWAFTTSLSDVGMANWGLPKTQHVPSVQAKTISKFSRRKDVDKQTATFFNSAGSHFVCCGVDSKHAVSLSWFDAIGLLQLLLSIF